MLAATIIMQAIATATVVVVIVEQRGRVFGRLACQVFLQYLPFQVLNQTY